VARWAVLVASGVDVAGVVLAARDLW
jgi:hypothetical protein